MSTFVNLDRCSATDMPQDNFYERKKLFVRNLSFMAARKFVQSNASWTPNIH